MDKKMDAPAENQGTQNTTNNDNDITLTTVIEQIDELLKRVTKLEKKVRDLDDDLEIEVSILTTKVRDMDEFLERVSYEVACL